MPDKQRDNHIKTLEAAGKSGAPGISPRDKSPNPKQQKPAKKKK